VFQKRTPEQGLSYFAGSKVIITESQTRINMSVDIKPDDIFFSYLTSDSSALLMMVSKTGIAPLNTR